MCHTHKILKIRTEVVLCFNLITEHVHLIYYSNNYLIFQATVYILVLAMTKQKSHRG